MPVYDYHCDHCGHAFSATGGFNDPALAACPRCGAVPRRLIGATAIVFKGSGWYKTDSRSAPKDGADAKPTVTGTSADKADKDKQESATAGDGKLAEPKPAAVAPAKSDPGAAAPAKSGPASSS